MPDRKPLALLTPQASKSAEALAAFEREGFEAESHPLVTTERLPDAEARKGLDWSDLVRAEGMVVTSATAAEAALHAMARSKESDAKKLARRMQDPAFEIVAVGEATARLCREWIRHRISVSSGQGQEGLVAWFKDRAGARGRASGANPWWMPCSRLASKRLATDAGALGFRVAMTPLYGPAPSAEGARGLLARLAELAETADGSRRWVAIYSPSAVQALAAEAGPEALAALRGAGARVAALGRTTAASWREEFGVDPDAVGAGTGSAELARTLFRWRA